MPGGDIKAGSKHAVLGDIHIVPGSADTPVSDGLCRFISRSELFLVIGNTHVFFVLPVCAAGSSGWSLVVSGL